MRRRVLALGLSVAIVGSGGLLLAARPDGGSTEATGAGQSAGVAIATSSVAVSRMDLVARTEVDGTLGYAGQFSVSGQLQGTVTALPKAGAVVERGQALYSVGNRPVTLLYGDLPAWRRLGAGMADGPDVRQLEQNLSRSGTPPRPTCRSTRGSPRRPRPRCGAGRRPQGWRRPESWSWDRR